MPEPVPVLIDAADDELWDWDSLAVYLLQSVLDYGSDYPLSGGEVHGGI